MDTADRTQARQYIHSLKRHSVKIAVQVADTDYGGGVYHGRYFALYDQARDLFWAALEVPYLSLKNRDMDLTVAQVNTAYLKPVGYGDNLRVDTRVCWLGRRSMGLEQQMWVKNEGRDPSVLTNKMEISLVCVSKGKAVNLPDDLRSAIQTYYGM